MSNLEMFTEVETIALSGNVITTITPESFAANLKLTFLSLSSNKLTSVENLGHLVNLQALNLSDNAIEEVDISQLPPNLLSLKLAGNPIEQRAQESGKLSLYRKPFVLGLQNL